MVLKKLNLLFHSSRALESESTHSVSMAVFIVEAQESHFLAFPAAIGYLHSLAHGHLLTSKPTMANRDFLRAHPYDIDSPASFFHI